MKAPGEFRREQLHRPEWYLERGGEWHLRASRCGSCESLIFPVATVCPRCWPPQQLEDVTVPETGKLLSWSTANVAPAGFRAPYSFGYADMTPTVRLFGQLDLAPDDPPPAPDHQIRLVLGVLRLDDEGQPVWAYKFAPAERRNA